MCEVLPIERETNALPTLFASPALNSTALYYDEGVL